MEHGEKPWSAIVHLSCCGWFSEAPPSGERRFIVIPSAAVARAMEVASSPGGRSKRFYRPTNTAMRRGRCADQYGCSGQTGRHGASSLGLAGRDSHPRLQRPGDHHRREQPGQAPHVGWIEIGEGCRQMARERAFCIAVTCSGSRERTPHSRSFWSARWKEECRVGGGGLLHLFGARYVLMERQRWGRQAGQRQVVRPCQEPTKVATQTCWDRSSPTYNRVRDSFGCGRHAHGS